MAHNTEDLINLLDEIPITQSTTKKEEKIEDLQIKMLEEFLKTSRKEKKSLTPEQDEEFRRFFDKYEKNYETDGGLGTKEVLNDMNKEKILKVVPSCSQDFNLPLSLLDDELSTVKNNFTQVISKGEIQYSSYILNEPKILTPKLNEDCDFSEDLIDEVLIEKNIENNYRKAVKAVSFNDNKPSTSYNKEKVDNYKLNDVNSIKETNNINFNDSDKKSNLELESSNEYEDLMNEIISTNKITCYGVKEVKNNKINDDNLKLKTKEEKEFINTLVTKYNLTYLEPVKRVEKTFKKRSMLKNDMEKVGLTPGPTLYEKAIVLPKMMKKLDDRKLEKDKKVERKLILGSGYPNIRNNIDVTKMDDKTLQKLQKVENFNKIDNETTSLKPENTSKGVISNNNILEPPKLVMKDCNRERLVAFETGRLFRNFIRTGSYFSESS